MYEIAFRHSESDDYFKPSAIGLTPPALDMTFSGSIGPNSTITAIRGVGTGADRREESFVQTFNSAGLLVSALRQRKIGTGSWEKIEKVSYGYHSGTTRYGSLGDLASSVNEIWDGTAWVAPKTTFYTYFKAIETSGFEHGLKFAFGPAAYAQMVGAGFDPMISFTINDSVFAQYADREVVQYEPVTRRVLLWRTNAGTMSYALSFTTTTTPLGSPISFRHWYQKSVLTRLDGSQQIVYSNFYGLAILSVLKSADGLKKWCSFTRYDDSGRAHWQISPSAITGYNEAKSDLLDYDINANKYLFVRDDVGLIQISEYDAVFTNYVKFRYVRKGQSATGILQSKTDYITQAGGGATRVLVSKQTVYTDESGMSPIETSYGYSFDFGTLQPSQIVTTFPVVLIDQNGSGTSVTTVQRFNALGNVTSSFNERGLVTEYSYDVLTGAMTQSIMDVGGQNLTSDSKIDSLGRTTQTLGPSHEAVVDGTVKTVRIASWTVYKDALDQTLTASGFAEGTTPTFTLVNPVSITVTNKGGNVLEQIQATRASTTGALSPNDVFNQTSYVRWTTNQYQQCCRISSTRNYKLIPATGEGAEGTNYDTTLFGYDEMQRRNQTTSPGGTINFSVFDDRGLVTAVFVGTNATGATQDDPTGNGAVGNNMVLVTQNEYDNGVAGGNGNLTSTWAWVDDSTNRQTQIVYDFRNRQISVTGQENAYSETTYDNLNRPLVRQTRNGSAAAVLLSRSQTDYDNRGRVFRTTNWSVNPNTGALGASIVSNTWYNPTGNVIKSLPAGSQLFSKTSYDILDRATHQYVGYDLDETTYAEALAITGDTILEQQTMTYNEIGTVISTVAKQRYHNAPASEVGGLGTPASTTPTPKARVTYSASWIDGVGRVFASADYGTNGGAAFTRPALVPTQSDTILVSTTSYNDDGEVFSTLDPKNTETRFEYDDVGRQLKQIENYVAGGTNADQNRTTWTVYTADGQVKSLTASNSDTGNQQTIYFYGTTLSDSEIASSQLLQSVRYPDSDGTNNDYVSYRYNRQGQQTLVTDQRGCQHAYDYDGLGRQIHDRVPTLGTNAVGASRRLSTVYDTRGMVSTVTTWDDPRVGFGSILNQVQNTYNDFGQQSHSYQAHDSSVNIMTTPRVQYSYASGFGNTIRMSGMTYPDGRILTYNYGSTGAMNDACSRIESVSDSIPLATYQYLGTSGFVNVASAQPVINWTLYGSGNDPNTGDIYSGLDRFGRVDNCLWQKSGTTLAQIQYGYDRASNRTWRKDGVLTGYDELYSYDGLYRLTDQKRGTLNGTQTAITSGTGTFQQQWGLDGTGNWKTFKQDNDGNGIWELNQTRTANKVNEITGISNSTGPVWATPTYDRAGNMIGMPNPPVTIPGSTPAWAPMTEAQWNTLTEAQWSAMKENSTTTPQQLSARYDAWNRLVLITNGTQKVSEHVYDARGYRIRKDTYTNGTLTEARRYYYTPGWQCVEERIGASTTAERQFVWGLRYIDDLVLRDRSTANNGTMNERRYAMQDDNWNTIATTDTAGAVTERFAYSAYGTPVFMTSAGVVQTSSPIGFETLYAGYRWDGTTPQMYYVRNRFLLPMIGTWNRRDPLGYVDEMSLYENCSSNVIVCTDASGLQPPGGTTWIPPRGTSSRTGRTIRSGGGPEIQNGGPYSGTYGEEAPRYGNQPFYGNYGPNDPWGINYWSEYIGNKPPRLMPGSGPRHQGPTHIGPPPKPLVLTQPRMAPVGSTSGGASSCNATSTLREAERLPRIPPNWTPPGWTPTESNGRCWCCEVEFNYVWVERGNFFTVYNCRRELPVDCLLRNFPRSRCLPDFIQEGVYDGTNEDAFEWDPRVPKPRRKE